MKDHNYTVEMYAYFVPVNDISFWMYQLLTQTEDMSQTQ